MIQARAIIGRVVATQAGCGASLWLAAALPSGPGARHAKVRP